MIQMRSRCQQEKQRSEVVDSSNLWCFLCNTFVGGAVRSGLPVWWEGEGKGIRLSWAMAVGLLWGVPGWFVRFVHIRSFHWVVTWRWDLSSGKANRSHLHPHPSLCLWFPAATHRLEAPHVLSGSLGARAVGAAQALFFTFVHNTTLKCVDLSGVNGRIGA